MSITRRILQKLNQWFRKTAVLTVSTTLLVFQASEEVLAVTHCFGEPTEDINLLGMIQKGDHVLITSFILICMAAYSLELIVDRSLMFAISRRQSLNYQRRVGSALFGGRFEEAASLSAEYPRSPVAFAVDAFVRSNTGGDSPAIAPSMREWQRSIVLKSAEIRRRLWALGAIGWSAPLVGLLYANIHVAQTIWAWHEAEATSFVPIANEIGNAAFGVSVSIIVAIPAIWANKYFSAQAETILLEMKSLSLAIIEQLSNQQSTAFLNSSSASYETQGLKTKTTGRASRVAYIRAFGHDCGP